jgi:hypothetical protein
MNNGVITFGLTVYYFFRENEPRLFPIAQGEFNGFHHDEVFFLFSVKIFLICQMNADFIKKNLIGAYLLISGR